MTKSEDAHQVGELLELGRSRLSRQGYGNREIVLSSIVRTIKEKHGGFLAMNERLRQQLDARRTGVTLSVADVALNLALPTKYTIAPFAVYLVARHPVLTDSALLGCELYNSNGKRVGLQKSDAGLLLIVKKGRKGAQQEVLLTEDTAAAVELLIQITAPLRTYLKDRNDDGWRRLFIIEGGQGFQKPYVFTNKISFAKILRQREFVGFHQHALGALVHSVSLARVRATAGILVYPRTLSVGAMADALGNSKRVTLNHYLPAPIMQFFQERWIRVFQNSVIVHALKDSPCLLLATDFNSMEEVDDFLKNHALLVLPELQAQGTGNENRQNLPGAGRSEIIVSLDVGILALLLSLKLAVEQSTGPVAGQALYWSVFAAKVEAHIEHGDFVDPYLRDCLAIARKAIDPAQFKGLVGEQG